MHNLKINHYQKKKHPSIFHTPQAPVTEFEDPFAEMFLSSKALGFSNDETPWGKEKSDLELHVYIIDSSIHALKVILDILNTF